MTMLDMCRAKEQELQQLQRSWSAASQQDGSMNGENERGKMQVKALEGQLRDLHSRLTRLQADTRYACLYGRTMQSLRESAQLCHGLKELTRSLFDCQESVEMH